MKDKLKDLSGAIFSVAKAFIVGACALFAIVWVIVFAILLNPIVWVIAILVIILGKMS